MQNMRVKDTIPQRRQYRARQGQGFTLIEVVAALGILALVASSVLVVVDRSMLSASDSTVRMEAFELARENMEKVLASESVEETVEYGRSDKYPDITWQTVVEVFSEPIGGATWVRAICSAAYKDSAGQQQKIELEDWITELTDQQANQLAGQPQSIEELTAEQLIPTAEQAAEYAGVDAETIEKWVENGLTTTADGAFIKYNLDVYVRSNGRPTDAEKRQQVESIEELAKSLASQSGEEGAPDGLQGSDDRDSATGMPQEQPEQTGAGDGMGTLNGKGRR
jgi:prepilin-type N-terminal cleavage/methylation domain-containing protein